MPSEIPTDQTRIAIGGMFRCCLASAGDKIRAQAKWQVGDTVATDCCGGTVMRLSDDGLWSWQPSVRPNPTSTDVHKPYGSRNA